ncbi:hypothetical protein HDU80_003044, partial [Chytriomyces hyalinus]
MLKAKKVQAARTPVKLIDACFDLDLSDRLMISFEGNIQQWAIYKILLKEEKYLHLQADIAKLRILLKIKSYFDPAFDGKFLDKANETTQAELDNAVQDVINNALVSEESAAITAAIDAHAADLNDSSEEQVQSDEDGATLTSALVSNLNDAIPANMKDVFGAIFKHAPIEESNEGEGEWLDSSDEEMDEKLKPAKKSKPLDIVLEDVAGMGTPSSATKKPVTSGKLPQVQISTGNSLMNEFEDMHSILYGLLPFKFLFAQGVELTASGTATRLKKPNMLHVTHQPYALIENDIDFISYMCNITKRHIGIQKCSILAKSNSNHFADFNSIVRQKNFKQQIQDAINDPTAPESKVLEEKISQVVLVSQRAIPYSTAARRSILSKAKAYTQFFEPQTDFITFSFSFMDSMLMLNMCNQRNTPVMLDQVQEEFKIDIPSLDARRKIVADHPGTAAKVCTKMLDAISVQLLGIQWSQ